MLIAAVGYTSTGIATRLCIGRQTVNTHIKSIYRKLDVRTRAQTVSLATKQQLFVSHRPDLFKRC